MYQSSVCFCKSKALVVDKLTSKYWQKQRNFWSILIRLRFDLSYFWNKQRLLHFDLFTFLNKQSSLWRGGGYFIGSSYLYLPLRRLDAGGGGGQHPVVIPGSGRVWCISGGSLDRPANGPTWRRQLFLMSMYSSQVKPTILYQFFLYKCGKKELSLLEPYFTLQSAHQKHIKEN